MTTTNENLTLLLLLSISDIQTSFFLASAKPFRFNAMTSTSFEYPCERAANDQKVFFSDVGLRPMSTIARNARHVSSQPFLPEEKITS